MAAKRKMQPKPSRQPLTATDIKEGKWYRAKHPQPVGWPPQYNDRRIIHIAATRWSVQYDGPAVHDGQHYPSISMEKFLAWASHEVFDGAES